MKKLKVLTVVGTRPEIIRLSRVMARLDGSQAIDHITVHTGQNYDFELNQIFYDDLEIRKPDYFLEAVGSSTAETIGRIISSIDPILEKEKPDAFLVLGDTNSCLCAIPAKKRQIPIFHMEAGNRCFDQRVPEETNRKIVDHIADINLSYSAIARDYLLREGIPPDRIIKTGSPMFEVINHYMSKIKASEIVSRLELKANGYFVVSAHREENVDNEMNLMDLIKSLNLIAEKYKMPIIFSTHPRTRKRVEMLKPDLISINPLIRFVKPLGFTDYNSLQINARAVLSDSGTISEESSILKLNALNIRGSHERPEAMEEAAVMMVGLKPDNILRALFDLLHSDRHNSMVNVVSDYCVDNVSEKVARVIISYVDYVNRVVYNKP